MGTICPFGVFPRFYVLDRTLISEPRFSTPLRDAISPTRKRENGLCRGFSLKRPFSLSRVGKIASRRGVESRGSLISVPLVDISDRFFNLISVWGRGKWRKRPNRWWRGRFVIVNRGRGRGIRGGGGGGGTGATRMCGGGKFFFLSVPKLPPSKSGFSKHAFQEVPFA